MIRHKRQTRKAMLSAQPPACEQDPEAQLALKYCGPVLDPSGYAEFARGFVKALARSRVPLCLEVVSYDKSRPDLGHDRDLLETLQRQNVPYRVKVINANPDCFRRNREPGCVNIGFTMFETTRIPSRWVQACNEMDGILVPSAWNRTVFERSGVKAPIRVASPGINVPLENEAPPAEIGQTIAMRQLLEVRQPARRDSKIRLPLLLRHRVGSWESTSALNHAKAFKFYSIFQWSERKNGHGLLRSYFSEFRKTDNVCLVLKTYGKNVTAAEQKIVADEVVAVRNSMQLPDHAPVVLIGGLLSQEQIRWLHHSCDCFVLPHRAEGFGMPHLEAMSHGKPVIATGFSGNLEFMDPENSVLLPYQLRPVVGMPSSDIYDGDMLWAEPDLSILRKQLRTMYSDRQFAVDLGRRAREDVHGRFSWTERVRHFLSVVNEIMAIAESRGGSAMDGSQSRHTAAEA